MQTQSNEVLSAIRGFSEPLSASTFAARGQRQEREFDRRNEIADYMTSLNTAIQNDAGLRQSVDQGIRRYGMNNEYWEADGSSRNQYGIRILPEASGGNCTLILTISGFMVRSLEGSKYRLIKSPQNVDDWAKSGVFGYDSDGKPFTRDSLDTYLAGRLRMLGD